MRAREPLGPDLWGIYVQFMERVDGNEDVSNIRVDLISSIATLQLLGYRVLKIQGEDPFSASQSELTPVASIHRLYVYALMDSPTPVTGASSPAAVSPSGLKDGWK